MVGAWAVAGQSPGFLPHRLPCLHLQGCVIAPKPTDRPLPPIAQPTAASASVASIIAQGWLLSPIVYMHPLEWSLLSDPKKWLEKGPIYDPTVGHALPVFPAHRTGTLQSCVSAHRTAAGKAQALGCASPGMHYVPTSRALQTPTISKVSLSSISNVSIEEAYLYLSGKIQHTANDHGCSHELLLPKIRDPGTALRLTAVC